jgi:hypothetical protein
LVSFVEPSEVGIIAGLRTIEGGFEQPGMSDTVRASVAFDLIGQSFVDEGLKLTSFLLSEGADSLEDLRIDLSGKFLASLAMV